MSANHKGGRGALHFEQPDEPSAQLRRVIVNKEIRRRTEVVGIFPNRASLLRQVGMLLAKGDDEWSVGRRYFSVESMAHFGAPQLVDPGVDHWADASARQTPELRNCHGMQVWGPCN